MPEDLKLETATNFAVTAAWVVGAVVAAYLIGIALSWITLRIGRRSHILRDVTELTRIPFRATLVVVAATLAVRRTSDQAAHWRGWFDHVLVIALIGVITWLVASLVKVVERRMLSRFGGGDAEMTDADRHQRRAKTQITTLRRLVIAVVVLLGGAAALMTFPSFANIGTTLFASAGVLSVVAGLAAQTSLGSVFAGMQIAFSDAIRVGDVVVLEEEWGRIEEITLTYVVVQLWDQRRLVLPTTYFTSKPFQNWTRNATELLGTTELDVDFTVPFDEMRAELARLLAASELWDGRVGILQVTDAVGGYVRVRMLVSAPNAPALFDLRCEVREGMVEWLQRSAPGAMPHWRLEGEPARKHVAKPSHANGRDKADSGLFTGSAEAEKRGKAFESPPDDDHAERTNGHRDDYVWAHGDASN
ncbi:MAG: mechanosensitive ion channel family protein [Mycobacterium sp.]